MQGSNLRPPACRAGAVATTQGNYPREIPANHLDLSSPPPTERRGSTTGSRSVCAVFVPSGAQSRVAQLAVPSRGHRTAVSPSCSKAAGEQFSPSGTRHRARCRCGRSTYRRTRAVATRSCRSWVPRVLAWRIVSRGDAGQGSRRRRRTAAARSRSPSRSSRRRVSGDPCAESKPGYVLVKASGTTGGT
jgi:hypothetical protein